MYIVASAKETVLEERTFKGEQVCKKCDSNEYTLKVVHRKVRSGLIFTAEVIKTEITCAKCGKVIRKKNYTEEMKQLVKEKENEYKIPFWKAFGKFFIALGIIVLIFAFVIGNGIAKTMKTRKNAKENYAQAYGNDKKEWLHSVAVGDYILANKNYDDPVQVFQITEITNDTITLQAFDQTFEYKSYETVEQLNQLELGKGNSTEINIKKKYFIEGIIEKVDVEYDVQNNLYIQQIKKNTIEK